MPTPTPQPSSSQDKSKDTRSTQSTPERDKAAQDLKTQDPNASQQDVDIDVDQSDDETYIVHTTSTVDDKGVRHDKHDRMTTDEYNERAKKEGW